jgi:hypothetical protein
MDQKGPEWTRMDQNGPEWTRMDQNGPEWTKVDQYGPKWTRMDQNGPDYMFPITRNYDYKNKNTPPPRTYITLVLGGGSC